MTSADFEMRGTPLSRTEALNMAAAGSLISGKNAFSSQFGSSSGPGDLCSLHIKW